MSVELRNDLDIERHNLYLKMMKRIEGLIVNKFVESNDFADYSLRYKRFSSEKSLPLLGSYFDGYLSLEMEEEDIARQDAEILNLEDRVYSIVSFVAAEFEHYKQAWSELGFFSVSKYTLATSQFNNHIVMLEEIFDIEQIFQELLEAKASYNEENEENYLNHHIINEISYFSINYSFLKYSIIKKSFEKDMISVGQEN